MATKANSQVEAAEDWRLKPLPAPLSCVDTDEYQRIEIDDAVAATNGKTDNRRPDKTSPTCD